MIGLSNGWTFSPAIKYAFGGRVRASITMIRPLGLGKVTFEQGRSFRLLSITYCKQRGEHLPRYFNSHSHYSTRENSVTLEGWVGLHGAAHPDGTRRARGARSSTAR